jgi:hypothetical protein
MFFQWFRLLYINFTSSCNCKSKAVPLPRFRWQGGEEICNSFLTSALNGGEWLASSSGRAFPPGIYTRNLLDRRLDGPQSWSEHKDQRKNHLPLPEIEHSSPNRPVRSQALYWLRYRGASAAVLLFIYLQLSSLMLATDNSYILPILFSHLHPMHKPEVPKLS